MEAELQAVLERGQQDDEDLELADESQHAEYSLIKNFLETFKSLLDGCSQGGRSPGMIYRVYVSRRRRINIICFHLDSSLQVCISAK